MPLYRFSCCDKEVEVLQGIDKDTPLCPDCGANMRHLPTCPAIITIKNEGGIKTHSEGYKQGYSDEYKRRLEDRLKVATS